MTGTKDIYIVRHAETDLNRLGIVQGRGVDSSINALGERQAQAFYDAYQHIGFERIYISTLQRTRQTMKPFIDAGIPFEKHAALDEISWGVHEGKADGDSFRDFYAILHKWKEGDPDAVIRGGESARQVQNRQLPFVEKVRHAPEKNMLICTHGRAMRILLCTLLDRDLREMDHFEHKNLSLYKVKYQDGTFHLDIANDTAHVHGA